LNKDVNSDILNNFFISEITLNELEHIKTSSKDKTKLYKVRRLVHWLSIHQDKYTVCPYKRTYNRLLHKFNLPETNDSKIIVTVLATTKKNNLIFETADLLCFKMAERVGLNAIYDSSTVKKEKRPQYTGYIESYFSEDELADIYSSPTKKPVGCNDLAINDYLLVGHKGDIVDSFKWTDRGLIKVPYITIENEYFGKIKPKDEYQRLAFDSLTFNDITLLGGPPGSGKTLIALSFLFSMLERGEIDRIVIFCNPVVAKDAAKLGFYPGSQREKLLSSQVGAVLSSKLGSAMEVDRLIDDEKLILMPAGDSRGYEVPPHSGVYILEAQNLNIPLLRMILQRIGENCKTIVDGDRFEQTDLDIYSGDNNGMQRMSEVFHGCGFFGQVDLKYIYRSNIAELADYM
jgi:predicted ribonuclease YlaK